MRLFTKHMRSADFTFQRWKEVFLGLIALSILIVVGYKVTLGGQLLKISISQIGYPYLFLAVVLLPLNYYLEALKWQMLVNRIDEKSLANCLKIILIGQSLNMITPFAVGDAYARFNQMTEGLEKHSLGGIFVSRLAQLIPTLSFGLFSVFYLLNHTLTYDFLVWIISAALVGVFTLVILLRRYGFGRIDQYLNVVKYTSLKSFAAVLGVAFMRYTVFTIQFVLVFYALASDTSFVILIFGIFWVFLIKTIVPNLTILGDLAKRELSAMAFFSVFIADVRTVLIAGFVIWLINIVVPSVVGLFFLPSLIHRS